MIFGPAIRWLLIVSLSVVFTMGARAQSLPAAVWYDVVEAGAWAPNNSSPSETFYLTSSGMISASATGGGDYYGDGTIYQSSAFSQADGLSGPTPSLSVQSVVPYGDMGYALADAQLNYSFEILGPNGTVPVLINANGSVTGLEPANLGSTNNSAESEIIISSNGIASSAATSVDDSHGVPSPSGSFTTAGNVYALDTNFVYRVTLGVATSAGSDEFIPGSSVFTATIDPTIQIDSALIDPSPYSLIFSDGIGNTAIPEPSTYAVILGIAALSFAAIRRKRKTA
jgi:hypothetical protein